MKYTKTLFILTLPFLLISCGNGGSNSNQPDSELINNLIKVSTSSGNLVVEHAHSLNSAQYLKPVDDEPGLSQIRYDGAIELTEISGDGKNFYRPVWASQSAGGVASLIEDLAPVSVGDADKKLLDFTLKLSRTTGENGLKVYLGEGTRFEPVTSQAEDSAQYARDQTLLNTLRMSVYAADKQGKLDNKIFVHAPVEETGATYIAKEEGKELFGVAGFTSKNDLEVKSAPFESKRTVSEAESNYPAIGSLSGVEGAAVYINFRIWSEGMDKDSQISTLSGQFRLALDLYCLEVL